MQSGLPDMKGNDFIHVLFPAQRRNNVHFYLTTGVLSYPWFAAHGSKSTRITPHFANAGASMVGYALWGMP